jgi:DNA-binding MarR family transcriptional regulator
MFFSMQVCLDSEVVPVNSTANPVQGGALESQLSVAEDQYPEQLERALRSMLELTVAGLERMEKKVGLSSLRALQSLRRQGPCMVTELANDLDLLVSTASRLSDRLAEAGLITRQVSPTNRRATQLRLAPAGHAVLDELVDLRAAALAEVTRQMSSQDRQDLLAGAQAFARARERSGGRP